MGARTVRITRDEFVTPPEFLGLHTQHDPASRVGGARVEFVRYGKETRAGTFFHQIPLCLVPPFSLSGEQVALLYLVNLTAGVMDGDAHLMEITARPDTRTVVTGQSATRIHPALGSFATQQWLIDVEDNACLVILPGPAIPFKNCRYFQRARVNLAPSARFVWGDIWLPGRYDRGALSERFQFQRIIQDVEVRRDQKLVFRDRYCWDGPWDAATADWFFGGQLACGSLLIAGPVPSALPPAPPGVLRSLFPLESGEYCVRWCGPPQQVTTDLVHLSLRLASDWTFGPQAHPWLLGDNELSPSHWFSTLGD